jgi:hypothetical protein
MISFRASAKHLRPQFQKGLPFKFHRIGFDSVIRNELEHNVKFGVIILLEILLPLKVHFAFSHTDQLTPKIPCVFFTKLCSF